VETAGIEPATAALAERARYLSCHPRGTARARTADLMHAMHVLYQAELQPHWPPLPPKTKASGGLADGRMAPAVVMLTTMDISKNKPVREARRDGRN
jgi:hypothetical protein